MDKIYYGIWGAILGDVLGVPYEFNSRYNMIKNQCEGLSSGGFHNQRLGTWSDDTSLILATIDSLKCGECDIKDISNKFLSWRNENEYNNTENGKLFDIGGTVFSAINNIEYGVYPSGGDGYYDNGNGSLMRMIPLVFYLIDKDILEIKKITSDVSSITHGNDISINCCIFYVIYCICLLNGMDKLKALKETRKEIKLKDEVYERIMYGDFKNIDICDIDSNSFVISSLEASLWCFINSNSYKESIIKAVNLGEDTDTIACITGGMSGIFYGLGEAESWIEKVNRYEYVNKLIKQFINE